MYYSININIRPAPFQRVCYDKNRDENGDGRIDKEEMKWYFPASNQMIGMYIGSFLNNESFPE